MGKKISRRAFLGTCARVALAGLGGCALAGCESLALYPEVGATPAGLGGIARRHQRVYGAAVQSAQLGDVAFARALRREAVLLVPENELKWDAVRPDAERFDFSGYRTLAAFAEDNAMAMRGHVLLWHHANPRWLNAALERGRMAAEKILERHMNGVLRETMPMIREWDVVNEAVDPRSPRPDGLRETLWLKALGARYAPLAFETARAADPDLVLVYNDFGLERGDGYGRRKRRLLLRLLEDWLKRGAPVDALGLQSHLRCHYALDDRDFAAFLREVRGMGLRLRVTELDVDAGSITGSVRDKIMAAQNYVAAYLDILGSHAPVDTVITWGLSDRYSWLWEATAGEGVASPGGMLPLDAMLDRAPLWETLRRGWAEDER